MQEEQKKSKKPFILALVAVTVCILVAAIIGSYYYQSHSNAHSQPIKTVEPQTIIRTVKVIKKVAPDGTILSERIEEISENDRNDSIATPPTKPEEDVRLLIKLDKTWNVFKNWVTSFFSSNKKPESENLQIKKVPSAIDKMLANIDSSLFEMEDNFFSYTDSSRITYIDHINKPAQLESFGIYIYIGITAENYTFHRTIIRYSDKKPIGLQSILIQPSKSDYALVVEVSDETLNQKQTTVFNEWVDLPPTQENNNLLNTIVSSDEVKITFLGTGGNKEWKVPAEDIETLRKSLYFYNLLKEKEELLKEENRLN